MATLQIPRSALEVDEPKVCIYCDTLTDTFYCGGCNEYKGLMTIAEWEEYTGETWLD